MQNEMGHLAWAIFDEFDFRWDKAEPHSKEIIPITFGERVPAEGQQLQVLVSWLHSTFVSTPACVIIDYCITNAIV
jgi:hypothetical protein